MSLSTLIDWLVSLLIVAGQLSMIWQKKSGWVLFLAVNVLLIFIAIDTGRWGQILGYIVSSCFCVLGFMKWSHVKQSNANSTEKPNEQGINMNQVKDFLSIAVIKRNGEKFLFESKQLKVTLEMSMLSLIHGSMYRSEHVFLGANDRRRLDTLVDRVVSRLSERTADIKVEELQNLVVDVLENAGETRLAKQYCTICARLSKSSRPTSVNSRGHGHTINVRMDQNTSILLSNLNLQEKLRKLAIDLPDVDIELVHDLAVKDLFNEVLFEEVITSLELASKSLIENDPAYGYLAARILLWQLALEVFDEPSVEDINSHYASRLDQFILDGINDGILDKRLSEFDLIRLKSVIREDRDLRFDYLGLKTLYDRYFLKSSQRIIEMPQFFFMRVAMGLAVNEVDRNDKAIQFYHVMSQFDFLPSSPTLFNAGTIRPQLSSCFLSTVPDDLDGIFHSIRDNALLQKFAGGVSNDWTPVRALGSLVRGTGGPSQGVIPFLKVANDTAVAVNQGGKRLGAVSAYLETWHMDIEEFLELKKNTGDDRRRTPDLNTAHWIPDLFMRRVEADEDWTLFSPADVPDLHEKYGVEFDIAYALYERLVAAGEITLYRTLKARSLWRKMLGMLFETGHPWITFKDAANIRNPQSHAGVIHHSNLCTEITLNTSSSEVAVCNLGSINLASHVYLNWQEGKRTLNLAKLEKTVKLAMRMLDNVIDINVYNVDKARHSNHLHRPVGLGMMGYHDCLQELGVAMDSPQALEFADKATEFIAYMAYTASADLAEERGVYRTFAGSTWDKGLMPIDTLAMLNEYRCDKLDIDMSSVLDWSTLKKRIAKVGMRNSNCIAIAPTATIANIAGVSSSIDPYFQNMFTKGNLSGEFTVLNKSLVFALKDRRLWDEDMIREIKRNEGRLSNIDRVPDEIKALYKTSFELDQSWLIDAAARRQKWIDQSQALNLYMSNVTGSKLDQLYRRAWKSGLKTTYYLRTLAASRIEGSTVGVEYSQAKIGGNGLASCAFDETCEACA